MLQTQDFRVSQEKKSYIRVNTRKLNEVLSIKVSILYILSYWFILQCHYLKGNVLQTQNHRVG